MRRLGRRDLGPWPWWWWLLGAIGVALAQAIGAGVLMSLAPPRGAEAVGAIGACVLASVVGLSLMHALRAHPPARDGMSIVPRRRDLLAGLGAMALWMPLVQAAALAGTLLYLVLRNEPPSYLSHDTLRSLRDDPGNAWTWGMVAAAVIGAPLAEEILFRGLLQTSLARLIGRPWPAVLLAATLFSLAHLGSGVREEQAHALIPLLVLGVGLGAAYERTARLWVPITMHACFNVLNVALTLAL
ncbi:MAG: CPBP family intramembrane metalloprotease [Phycisphaerae bacterium]|nr:CPBP family intramembrane metalloprotease [Phycisphaerae bacterium]